MHIRVMVTFLLFPFSLSAQEWSKNFRELKDSDPLVREAALKTNLKVLTPRLMGENLAAATKEVAEIARELESPDDQIRAGAAGTLSTVAVLRPDGSDVLRGVMPLLIAHMQDNAADVRAGLARAVAFPRPEISREALRPLMQALGDPNAQVAGIAAYGVARFAGNSTEATDALLQALLAKRTHPDVRRSAIQAIGTFRLKHDERLVAALGTALSDPDLLVVKEALGAIGKCGPDAIGKFRARIEELAGGPNDQWVAQLAASVLAGEARRE